MGRSGRSRKLKNNPDFNCVNKFKYNSEQLAADAVYYINERFGYNPLLEYYQCKVCPHYHVGHLPTPRNP